LTVVLFSFASRLFLHSFPTRRSSDLPLVAIHFHQIAWVGLIANLLIVPFVGFLVVPLGLLGCVGTLLSGSDSLVFAIPVQAGLRSEEHTSELQSRVDLVCRLLLEKKK